VNPELSVDYVISSESHATGTRRMPIERSGIAHELQPGMVIQIRRARSVNMTTHRTDRPVEQARVRHPATAQEPFAILQMFKQRD
jgi:hypothetical protein